jgi:hypothetical protein
MQGESFTSARIEVTRDQIAPTPAGRMEIKAELDGLGLVIRRVNGAPATHIIVGLTA